MYSLSSAFPNSEFYGDTNRRDVNDYYNGYMLQCFQRFFLTWSFQILNITLGQPKAVFRQGPVQIVFAVREKRGFLNGSEVSELLRNLSVVEFSFYLGFPVQHIAERE